MKRILTGLCQMQGIILNYLMHRPINDLTHAHIHRATPPQLAYSLFLRSYTCAPYAAPMCVLRGKKYASNISYLHFYLLSFRRIVNWILDFNDYFMLKNTQHYILPTEISFDFLNRYYLSPEGWGFYSKCRKKRSIKIITIIIKSTIWRESILPFPLRRQWQNDFPCAPS